MRLLLQWHVFPSAMMTLSARELLECGIHSTCVLPTDDITQYTSCAPQQQNLPDPRPHDCNLNWCAETVAGHPDLQYGNRSCLIMSFAYLQSEGLCM